MFYHQALICEFLSYTCTHIMYSLTIIRSSNGDSVIQSVSLLLSSQVDVIGLSTSVQPSIEDPVVLMFDYSTVCNYLYFCLEIV